MSSGARPRRWSWPVALIVLAPTALGGCTSTPGSASARAAAQSFYDALAAQDVRTACGRLAPQTLSKLEDSAGKPCTDALPEQKIEPGRIQRIAVYGHSAFVQTESSAAFLGRFPDGWRLTAAGCDPRRGLPYDCAVEG
ncbi:MAG TPA: hypothetical protein VMZ00_16730 [Sporichthya sp.]|nr:hypothetical protein [Sporichthya sp.]